MMMPDPTPETVAELCARLRNTPNWLRQDFGNWKDATSHYDRAPFEAAAMLEALSRALAERDLLVASLTMSEMKKAMIQSTTLGRAERAEAELAAALADIAGEQGWNMPYAGEPEAMGKECLLEWRKLRAELAAARKVPPREPTEEMFEAARCVWEPTNLTDAELTAFWRAMYDAAQAHGERREG